MKSDFRFVVAFGALAALAGCGQGGPPAELSGLWASGEGACAAGLGVRFSPDAVRLSYGPVSEVLVADPHYTVTRSADGLRAQIRFQVHSSDGPWAGSWGLSKGADGVLRLAQPVSQSRTGPLTRVQLGGPTAAGALALRRCGERGLYADLRGRNS